MCKSSSPPAPPPPPVPPPTRVSEEVKRARNNERDLMNKRKGQNSTILTSPSGLQSEAPTGATKILGG